MKDPVSGVFRVADWYDKGGASSGRTLTGVIVADGLAPTPAEAPTDHQGKWVGQQELPVIVDRADPSNFRIEWDQIIKNGWRETARQRADEAAARLAAGDQPARPLRAADVRITSAGGLSPLIDQVLRSAGMDPTVLNTSHSTVRIETGFDGGGPAGQLGHTVESTGVVRAVHDVVPRLPLPAGMSQADLTLDVARQDGTTYPVTTRIGFLGPRRRAAIATVGTQLPVLVVPSNPGRVTIDIARLNLP